MCALVSTFFFNREKLRWYVQSCLCSAYFADTFRRAVSTRKQTRGSHITTCLLTNIESVKTRETYGMTRQKSSLAQTLALAPTRHAHFLKNDDTQPLRKPSELVRPSAAWTRASLHSACRGLNKPFPCTKNVFLYPFTIRACETTKSEACALYVYMLYMLYGN